MAPRFVSPVNLAAVRLDEAAPIGLFRAIEHSRSALFLVVDHENARRAIFLEGMDGRYDFCSFLLGAQSRRWAGIALGPVELLVDVSSCVFTSFGTGDRGSVTIRGGGAYINVSDEHGYGSMACRVASSAPSNSDSLAFGSWQFVQRDHLGNPVVLFSTAPEQTT